MMKDDMVITLITSHKLLEGTRHGFNLLCCNDGWLLCEIGINNMLFSHF